MTLRPAPFLAALLFSAVSTLAVARTLVHAGALIDGVSAAPKKQMTIVIDSERIVAVQQGYTAAAAGDNVIDLTANTVMPGWIDCHVHLDSQISATSYGERFTMNPGDYALRAASNAKKTLLAGFTTVRNVGDTAGSTIALRKAITAGIAVGPRIYTAGGIISTVGGHGDGTNGASVQIMGDPGPAQGIINGPDEARKAVRQHFKEGADLIKITATGGVLDLSTNAAGAQFTPEELHAIVGTAHEYGLKVAAHAHGTEGMKRAIEAGVDSIEHGTFMTDEVVALMKQHGTYYIPTLSAGRWVLEKAKVPGALPAMVVPKALLVGAAMNGTFQRADQAGVKIAFGTDQGVAPHGENAREFIYMVEAGMNPMKAIQSATLEGARLLGAEKDLGSVEAGKLADLVAVPGDPLTDIKVVMKVSFVMKGGVVYRP